MWRDRIVVINGGRSSSGEDHGSRRLRCIAVLYDAEIVMHHPQHIQQLPLVLVDALDLHVKHGARIGADPGFIADDARQFQLILHLDFGKTRLEGGIVCQRFELAQL